MACNEDNFIPHVVPANYGSSIDIPIRKNITQNFYVSTFGKLNVIFKTKNILASKDTLYIGYFLDNNAFIDTLIGNVIPISKVYKTNTLYISLFWGRGCKGFQYDKKYNSFRNVRDTNYRVSGEPIINNVELNY